MTRYAIDAATALRIIDDDRTIPGGHSLVGPALLRSEALAALYRLVRDGRLDEGAGREKLEQLAGLKIRLLGDRVSRATAWKIAAQLDWDDTSRAEYLAVGKLQADALVTQDAALAAGAEGIIPVADYEALFEG
ncbi:hypothetical protein [Microbacterium sp. CFBP9034]|uniref:type II toxin-antitoxin system VapC family toxin n=1 Tax=Microbacterium sp. CFBP9034 TaxID=3096540 RepID=UPI002A6B8729|nr:hypothetical protein [Microbacterium sp. CFBP9034]MDY0910689.1 hypothetical protein [Microbacterium sp. CFBP9034]